MKDDPISRQAAIEATCYNCTEKEICNGICDDTDRLRELPTIDTVKHGKWINDKGLYRCSACDNLWTTWWAGVVPEERMYKEMKYCPNCGAQMENPAEDILDEDECDDEEECDDQR